MDAVARPEYITVMDDLIQSGMPQPDRGCIRQKQWPLHTPDTRHKYKSALLVLGSAREGYAVTAMWYTIVCSKMGLIPLRV